MSPQLQPPKCTHCEGYKVKHENLCKRHFQALQKVWARKLEKAGFEDIENPEFFPSGNPDGSIKNWASSDLLRQAKSNPVLYESKGEYYRLAGQFLHEYQFANKTEKLIFELHSEGDSIVTIVGILGSKRIRRFSGRKVCINNVFRTIKRLTGIMLGKLK